MTEIAAAAFENLMLLIMSTSNENAVAKAPLKVSPAAVVSKAFTFSALM